MTRTNPLPKPPRSQGEWGGGGEYVGLRGGGEYVGLLNNHHEMDEYHNGGGGGNHYSLVDGPPGYIPGDR